MSRKNTSSVFLRAFLQIIIVAVCMVIVAFASYHAVFWYFQNGHNKTTKRTEQAESGIVYTAIMFQNTDKKDTEGIMVKALHTDTNNVDMIMVPTNTEISAGSQTYSQLKEKSDVLPEPMTLGEIPTYVTDKTDSCELTVTALEEVLGIDKISYYEEYDQEELVSIVNLLPEQTLEVPITITDTDMNGNDIRIEQGTQSLDGIKACALLSFTGYPQGVLDQTKIIAQFFEKYYTAALGLDESSKQEMYENYYQIVTTNQGDKVLKTYEDNFLSMNSTQIRFHLLDGTQSGTLYQVDSTKLESLLQEIEGQTEAYTDEQDMLDFYVTPATSSKELEIKVYNGTKVEGLATEWVHRLSADGYNIIGAANDNSEEKQQAIIYVKEEGTGLDLKAYFPDAEYITDPSLDGMDIKIVLGMEQAQS